MSISSVLARVSACLALATPAVAQEDLSIDEIVALFDKQANLFREAEASDLGQTRGLRLVTIDDLEVEKAAGTEAAAPETTTGVTVSVDTGSSDSSGSGSDAVLTQVSELGTNRIGQLDEELQINLNIAFAFDSAVLDASEAPKLQKMCAAMQLSTVNLFRVVGHTDISGTDVYNERLSVLRAKEVARHLIEDCGIAPDRLETVGMGERTPLNANNPRADENRRVEFQALG